MTPRRRVFGSALPARLFGWGDFVVLLVLIPLLYLGVRLAFGTPEVVRGPSIDLSPAALPYYAVRSLGRMLAAYGLSLSFSLIYGYAAARNKAAGRWLLPLLDVLQSVPILSFLPVVLLGLTAVLPQRLAVELAAIILIFTSQAWNLTFSFYQSLTTLPTELREAAAVFRLSSWLRLKRVELPFAAVGLIWNSVMSWAGGWFFLIAAEIFTVGARDFRLPGLGAYLQTAAARGDQGALLAGLATLVGLIVLLDQLVWRPLLAWADKFKLSQVEAEESASSWFLEGLRRSRLARAVVARLLDPLANRFDRSFGRPPAHAPSLEPSPTPSPSPRSWLRGLGRIVLAGLVGLGIVKVALFLAALGPAAWLSIGVGAGATLLRVAVAVALALVWTVPLGVVIGTSRRAASVLQPIVEVLAAVPATALFPVLLLGLVSVPNGANLAAIVLMMLGTQWYVLFNAIAGAQAIPQDLKDTSDLLRLAGWRRWRTLVLPALFPYVITGLITASGGAWNASIVAEYASFGGRVSRVTGLGALITSSTAVGNYPLLLASTLAMIALVVTVNRLVWRGLFRLAEERFRLEP